MSNGTRWLVAYGVTQNDARRYVVTVDAQECGAMTSRRRKTRHATEVATFDTMKAAASFVDDRCHLQAIVNDGDERAAVEALVTA